MLNQAEVNKWLADFVERLRNTFSERLIFVGHHGSWARGEAGPESDIDTIVILDHIESKDLTVYRDVIDAMSDAKRLASSFLGSISELRVWPRTDMVQLYYGCKSLHGTLDGLVDKPIDTDFIEDIRIKAAENLHLARHYLLHPHDLGKVVHKLYNPFKCCFFALQSWILLRDGKFLERKDDLLNSLSDADDREVICIARDWSELNQDRESRPLYYIQLLERWSRNMLSKFAETEFLAKNSVSKKQTGD